MTDYIEREAAKRKYCETCNWYGTDLCNGCATPMSRIPAADVVPVVRCKDCSFWCKEMSDDGKTEFVNYSYCQRGIRGDGRDFYCAIGKRRSDDIGG